MLKLVYRRTNTARTLAAAVIGTRQEPAPLHAPAHALRRHPFAGLATRRTGT
jgi:hypothetical protein